MRPVPAEDFSSIIGTIYDCALDPSLWSGVLASLCEAMRFHTSTLALQEVPSGRLLLRASHGIADSEMERRFRLAGPLARSLGAAAAVRLPRHDVQGRVDPPGQDGERVPPSGPIDALAMAFTCDAASISSLGFGRRPEHGPVVDDDLALARLFVPHLKRSLAINRLLEVQALERVTFAAVLDRLAVAVLLVASDLRLLHANRAGEALLRTADPLGVRHGRVAAASGLSGALRAALAVPAEGTGRHGTGIPARRSDGEELVIHLLPLAPAGAIAGAVAAVFVAPAVTPRPAPLAAIAALFDLTPGEARVLELIGAGRTNAEIAVVLGVAISTVRTHLLRLFEKTGTHRQAELVGLVASFTLPLA